MGQVVPFIARVRDSGDWTAAERARLDELGDRLAATGLKVEVIFGATDEGDPWCVVTDEHGDVLIHVARIGGRFVVHSAVDDTLSEGVDLHAVLRDRLDAAETYVSPTAEILPFAREAQSFIALIVAAAFFYETAGVLETAEAAELPSLPLQPDDTAQLPDQADAPMEQRAMTVQAASLQTPEARPAKIAPTQGEPAPAEGAGSSSPEAAAAAPAESPPPAHAEAQAQADPPAALAAEEPVVITGTAGHDLLIGTSASERIEGGDGNDTLRGGGGRDTLIGGAGDDRIELTSQAVAEGGSGADTFVIQAPPPGAHGGLLGVVVDFDAAAGDRLIDTRGQVFHVPARPLPGDGQPPHAGDAAGRTGPSTSSEFGFGPSTALRPDATPPLTRIEIDLDGDGSADGYVLVGIVGSAPPPAEAETPITVTGQSLGTGDPFA